MRIIPKYIGSIPEDIEKYLKELAMYIDNDFFEPGPITFTFEKDEYGDDDLYGDAVIYQKTYDYIQKMGNKLNVEIYKIPHTFYTEGDDIIMDFILPEAPLDEIKIIPTAKYDILNLKEFEVKWPLDKLQKAVIDPNTNKPYTTTAEFKKANYNAWKSAGYQNLLTTLIPNLTPEDIKKVVFDSKTNKKRFCTSDEFKKAEPKAYDSAKKLGILYDLYFDAKQYKDWTPEELKQGAIDCKTGKVYISRNAFANGNKRAYEAARYHGVLDQLISFKGEYNKAFIYVFKFSDKQNNPTSAYIGLSTNPELRKKEHTTGINRRKKLQNTAVTDYINNHPEEKYEFEILTPERLEVGKTDEERLNSPAGKAEKEWAERFKNKGYKIINKRETGKDFGNTPVESEEELMSQALKYKSWTDLMRAGMPPQYSNPNNFKSGLYQKIRRKDETNPGFTKKVKQAIDQKQSIAETQYLQKSAVIRNKDVPSTNYYRGLLKIANLTQSRVDAINNVLNNIDKNNKKATEKEYILLQALKTGNFKYSTKN